MLMTPQKKLPIHHVMLKTKVESVALKIRKSKRVPALRFSPYIIVHRLIRKTTLGRFFFGMARLSTMSRSRANWQNVQKIMSKKVGFCIKNSVELHFDIRSISHRKNCPIFKKLGCYVIYRTRAFWQWPWFFCGIPDNVTNQVQS